MTIRELLHNCKHDVHVGHGWGCCGGDANRPCGACVEADLTEADRMNKEIERLRVAVAVEQNMQRRLAHEMRTIAEDIRAGPCAYCKGLKSTHNNTTCSFGWTPPAPERSAK